VILAQTICLRPIYLFKPKENSRCKISSPAPRQTPRLSFLRKPCQNSPGRGSAIETAGSPRCTTGFLKRTAPLRPPGVLGEEFLGQSNGDAGCGQTTYPLWPSRISSPNANKIPTNGVDYSGLLSTAANRLMSRKVVHANFSATNAVILIDSAGCPSGRRFQRILRVKFPIDLRLPCEIFRWSLWAAPEHYGQLGESR